MQNKQRKTPMRMCVGCREMKLKKELIRVVRAAAAEGESPTISLDFKGKKPGRGAYVCRDKECLQKAKKSRALQRALLCEITEDVFNEMSEVLDKGADGA